MNHSRRAYNTRQHKKGWNRKKTFPRERFLPSEAKWRIGLKIHLANPGKEKARVVKSVARENGISRSYCYKLEKKVCTALSNPMELLPDLTRDSEPMVSAVILDSDLLDRIVLNLSSEGKCSKEAISRFFKEVLRWDVSPTTIARILSRHGVKAATVNKELDARAFPKIKVIGMDEIFQGDQPVLTVVDLENTYALFISAEKDRKSETWEAKAKMMTSLGLDPELVISDGCGSILVTIPKAFEGATAQLDVFHAMKDVSEVVFGYITHVESKIEAEGKLEFKILNMRTYAPTKKQAKDLREELKVLVENADNLEATYKLLVELLGFSGYSIDDTTELLRFLIDELKEFYRNENCARCNKREKCSKCQTCSRLPNCQKVNGRVCMDCPSNRNCCACADCHRCPNPDECKYRNEGKALKRLEAFEANLSKTLKFLDVFYRKLSSLDAGMPEEFAGIHEEVYHLWRYGYASLPYLEALDVLEQKYGVLMVEKVQANVKELIGNSKRASSLVECLNSRIRPVMNSKRKVPEYFMDILRLKFNTRVIRRSRVATRVGHSAYELVTGETCDFYELLGLKEATIVQLPISLVA